MPVKQIGSTLTTQLWTPTIGELLSGVLYSVGYTAKSGESYYTVRDGICVAYAVFECTTTWGVSSSRGTWRMSLPVTPDLMGTDRHYVGYADHNTYANRGMHAVCTLTSDTAGYILFEPIEVPYAGSNGPRAAAVISNANWSSYIVQFFGGYGALAVTLEYKVAR